MTVVKKQKYYTAIARTSEEIRQAQALRFRRFYRADVEGVDQDMFDDLASHMLVKDAATDELVCCFRLMHFKDGSEISASYSAQFYELSALSKFSGPMLEMGRFCIAEDRRDPDILRVAWGALSRYVDANNVELLFGCSSFTGTEIDIYEDTFALLKEKHLAPRRWLPRVKAPSVFRFARKLKLRKPDLKIAMRAMPPLLRTYLVMGGWVSDHAVVDRNLNTLHVFTGLEIGRIPKAFARSVRSAAT